MNIQFINLTYNIYLALFKTRYSFLLENNFLNTKLNIVGREELLIGSSSPIPDFLQIHCCYNYTMDLNFDPIPLLTSRMYGPLLVLTLLISKSTTEHQLTPFNTGNNTISDIKIN